MAKVFDFRLRFDYRLITTTSTGERESRPFSEEPWHLHYVSWLSMHSVHSALPTCQPPFMVRSLQLVEVRPYAEEEEEDTTDSGRALHGLTTLTEKLSLLNSNLKDCAISFSE